MSEKKVIPILSKRWWRELFSPSLKCERLGHDMTTRRIDIRKRADSSLAVCYDYRAKQDYCKRCNGNRSEPYDLKKTDWFTSVSMPTSMWDEIDENGYLIKTW